MEVVTKPRRTIRKQETINNSKSNQPPNRPYLHIKINVTSPESIKKQKEMKLWRYLPTSTLSASIFLK